MSLIAPLRKKIVEGLILCCIYHYYHHYYYYSDYDYYDYYYDDDDDYYYYAVKLPICTVSESNTGRIALPVS